MKNKNVQKNEISVESLSTIKVENDENLHSYTNESLFEFIKNRKSNIVPQGIETSSTFVGAEGGGGHMLPVGTWIPPVGAFNIGAAIRKAAEIVCSKSQSSCAKYVRIYLQAGGLNMNGHPTSAYQYSGFLPSRGFKLIATLNTRDSQTNFTKMQAKPGDVAVMAHGKHGHICMFTGRQWVSDFVQNNMWVYGGNGTCQIFRYTV